MRTPARRVTAALLSCAAAVAGALLATGDRAGAAGTGGPLYGWGENSSGQVGIDWVTDLAHPVTQPVAVSVPADVVQVTTAMGISGAVRADGSVWIWGSSPPGRRHDVRTPVSAVSLTGAGW
jgi:alpha-tubulin suppressor-like RCC1 family protein